MTKKTRLVAAVAMVVSACLIVVGSVMFISHLNQPEAASTRLQVPLWILGLLAVISGVWAIVTIWVRSRKGRI